MRDAPLSVRGWRHPHPAAEEITGVGLRIADLLNRLRHFSCYAILTDKNHG